MAQALTGASSRSQGIVCLLVLFVGLLVPSVQADTLRLIDGSVLTGDVRQVTDSIIEVKTDGKVRFISINRLQPEDRARFDKDSEPPVEAADGPDSPANQTPTNSTGREVIPGSPVGADTIPQEKDSVFLAGVNISRVVPAPDFTQYH